MKQISRHSLALCDALLSWWARCALPTLQHLNCRRVGKGAPATCPPKKSSTTLVLLLLALVFLAPGIAALCFFKHPQWLSKQATNRGQFVNPPLSVKALRQLSSKWHLVLWSPHHCLQKCEKRIDQLTRVRLALGRRYYDVDQVLLIGEDNPPVTERLKNKLHHHGTKVLRTESNCAPDSKIFIANPEGYLVLSYAMTAEADDIYRDLKQLLTTTQTKSN